MEDYQEVLKYGLSVPGPRVKTDGSVYHGTS